MEVHIVHSFKCFCPQISQNRKIVIKNDTQKTVDIGVTAYVGEDRFPEYESKEVGPGNSITFSYDENRLF